MSKSLIITGGAGFIGSALIRYLIKYTDYHIINLDKLTYAGHLSTLSEISDSSRYSFVQGDIVDFDLISSLLNQYQPIGIIHLAAESHVDRSIDGPADFIKTNINGTFSLLQASLKYFKEIIGSHPFRFHHVSTDEVYGSLGEEGLFTEESRYEPNSPYSSSKAASDHLVRAWGATYGLPIVITNCSNNYGSYQFPEKLIPLVINNALKGKELPVYGDGKQIRDWLFVDDHVRALVTVFEKGELNQTYNIGGNSEKQNIEVVKEICSILDELLTSSPHRPHAQLIRFVQDRPGHDRRYAIDASKIKSKLGWTPQETFSTGLRKTIKWYLDHQDWVKLVSENRYDGSRLGIKK